MGIYYIGMFTEYYIYTKYLSTFKYFNYFQCYNEKIYSIFLLICFFKDLLTLCKLIMLIVFQKSYKLIGYQFHVSGTV